MLTECTFIIISMSYVVGEHLFITISFVPASCQCSFTAIINVYTNTVINKNQPKDGSCLEKLANRSDSGSWEGVQDLDRGGCIRNPHQSLQLDLHLDVWKRSITTLTIRTMLMGLSDMRQSLRYELLQVSQRGYSPFSRMNISPRRLVCSKATKLEEGGRSGGATSGAGGWGGQEGRARKTNEWRGKTKRDINRRVDLTGRFPR